MCSLGFIEQIEGLLGEGHYLPELLIVLREPHETDSRDNQIFWFKGEVAQRQCGGAIAKKTNSTATRFYNIYSILAKKLIETEDEFVLRRCAYMNLHPFCGEEKAGNTYKRILRELQELPLEESVKDTVDIRRNRDPREVAKHRISIIQRAIDNGVKNIITTEDIYYVIRDKWSGCDEKSFFLPYKYKKQDQKKEFHVCWLGRNKETRLISFRHPSCTSISMEHLKELQIP